MHKYNPNDFPYPLNESMQEVYDLHDKGDMDNLIPAIYHLYFDIKDLYTFKKVPLKEVQAMQDYFRGFIE